MPFGHPYATELNRLQYTRIIKPCLFHRNSIPLLKKSPSPTPNLLTRPLNFSQLHSLSRSRLRHLLPSTFRKVLDLHTMRPAWYLSASRCRVRNQELVSVLAITLLRIREHDDGRVVHHGGVEDERAGREPRLPRHACGGLAYAGPVEVFGAFCVRVDTDVVGGGEGCEGEEGEERLGEHFGGWGGRGWL